LENYAPALVGIGGDYEFGKKANVTSLGSVTASVLSVDGNRFQYAGVGQNVTSPGATARGTYAGLSTYGNTTNNNDLNLTGGNHANARAGYTDAQSGGSIRDDNVIATCDKYGIAMAMTHIRLFHH